jgi:hypothetical protein
MRIGARGWWLVGALWLAVILWVTLQSAPDQAIRALGMSWSCVLCGEAGIADFLLNILLFAPLGLAAAALRSPRWRALLAAIALTVTIETIQRFVLVGRVGAIGDVLANTGGAVLGWLLYPGLLRFGAPTRSFGRRGSAVVFCLTSAIWFATGLGLHPATSMEAPWIGQLQHRWPGQEPFPGTIDTAQINGVAFPNDPFDAPLPLGDSVRLHVALTRTMPLPVHGTSIVQLVDRIGRHQISLSGSGADIVAEIQVRASHWGLHTPEWEFPGAMAVPIGVRWSVDAEWTGERVSLTTSASGGADPVVRVHPLSVALGWVFIHPFVRIVSSNGRFWSYLWLAWWFGVLGWLAGAVGWRTLGFAAAAQIAVLVLAATVTATPWHADELAVALCVCAMAGAAARWRAAPLS